MLACWHGTPLSHEIVLAVQLINTTFGEAGKKSALFPELSVQCPHILAAGRSRATVVVEKSLVIDAATNKPRFKPMAHYPKFSTMMKGRQKLGRKEKNLRIPTQSKAESKLRCSKKKF